MEQIWLQGSTGGAGRLQLWHCGEENRRRVSLSQAARLMLSHFAKRDGSQMQSADNTNVVMGAADIDLLLNELLLIYCPNY